VDVAGPVGEDDVVGARAWIVDALLLRHCSLLSTSRLHQQCFLRVSLICLASSHLSLLLNKPQRRLQLTWLYCVVHRWQPGHRLARREAAHQHCKLITGMLIAGQIEAGLQLCRWRHWLFPSGKANPLAQSSNVAWHCLVRDAGRLLR